MSRGSIGIHELDRDRCNRLIYIYSRFLHRAPEGSFNNINGRRDLIRIPTVHYDVFRRGRTNESVPTPVLFVRDLKSLIKSE